MIPIFITTWHRPEFLEKCLRDLREFTHEPHSITVWDNGSEPSEVESILKNKNLFDNLILWKENSGCFFPKLCYHIMVPEQSEFYVVNDADVFPPNLGDNCWLKQLIAEMNLHKDIGILAAQLPPQIFQGPVLVRGNHTICTAVGNTLKVIRRQAVPLDFLVHQKLGQYGDDDSISKAVQKNGYHVAFHQNVWCLHAGQTHNWGYKAEQISGDPRKAGLGPPYEYEYDPRTYEPLAENLKKWNH